MLKGTKKPGNQIREELEITLKIIMNKLHKLKSCETQIDQLNFFLAQNKGDIVNIYNFGIRRQFLKIKHPSFDKKWLTIFKWQDKVSDSKVKSYIDR